MLSYELDQLSTQFTRSVLFEEPGRQRIGWSEHTHEWIFRKTRLPEWVNNASQSSRPGATARPETSAITWGNLRPSEGLPRRRSLYVLVFLVRLLVLCLTLPLFLMAAFVGFVDGLVRRDIRRFGAGRESGFVYHRAMAALMPLVVLPWGLYLALPVSISPLLILLPAAVLLGVAVSVATGSFKKYL